MGAKSAEMTVVFIVAPDGSVAAVRASADGKVLTMTREAAEKLSRAVRVANGRVAGA